MTTAPSQLRFLRLKLVRTFPVLKITHEGVRLFPN